MVIPRVKGWDIGKIFPSTFLFSLACILVVYMMMQIPLSVIIFQCEQDFF
jgi:hypothetical protein